MHINGINNGMCLTTRAAASRVYKSAFVAVVGVFKISPKSFETLVLIWAVFLLLLCRFLALCFVPCELDDLQI